MFSYLSLFLCTPTFEPFRGGVRRTQMRSRFLACLNGRPQKVAMSRRDQTRFVCIDKLRRCVLQTVGPAAARFLRTSIKADTKSLGRSLCLVEQPPSELSKLWRTEIIEKRQKENTPNSWFRITSIKRIGWTPHETKEALQCTPNRFTDGSVRYRK